MKINTIDNNQVQIYNGLLTRDPKRVNSHIIILILDEYLKSKNYQNLMRQQKQFAIGGDLLYLLLTELFDYITRLFERIRLEDLNLNEGNKTLLFLKKFSTSSNIIEKKINALNTMKTMEKDELFILHISGLENNIDFTRNQDGNSKLSIEVPVSFIYNRMISFVDKMNFAELNSIDKDTRNRFLAQFKELNQRIMDHKKQIEMKYALELAQERARDLELENENLMVRINQVKFQNDLYKRSYFSLKNRYKAIIMKINGADPERDDENLEEL